MKYTIYKLSGKFNPHRWWRNYDSNNIGAPDTDIETYVASKGLTWSQLLNSNNEPCKYQTISKDSFDKIELTIGDFKNIPDYLKITFTKDTGELESMYYYIDTAPSVYNAIKKLASRVTYTLDKKASYFYKFHSALKTLNPSMFYVRKHTNRFLYDTATSKYYFDFNTQPWLNINKDESDLLVTEKLLLSKNDLIEQAINGKTNIQVRINDDKLEWLSGSTWRTNWSTHDILSTDPDASATTYSSTIVDGYGMDFDGRYEYVLTKTKGFYRSGGNNHTFIHPTKFMLWPINNYERTSGSHTAFDLNKYNTLKEKLPVFFGDSDIIGRFVSPLSPLAMLLIFTENDASIALNSDKNILCNVYGGNKTNETPYTCMLVDGIPKSFTINPLFKTKLQACLTDINNANVTKTKAHNPHLFSPMNYKLTYAPNTNERSSLTCDFMDLKQYSTMTTSFDTFIASDWNSRLITNNWNTNKLLSQSGNELSVNDGRQAPIQSTAWENTWLQRQVLDTGRNAQVKGGITSITGSTIGIIASLASFLFGPIGWIAGAGGLAGSIMGLTKSAINLQSGLAQNEAQRKALLSQSSSLNNPVGTNGLSCVNTWANDGMNIYTQELSEQDSNIINNDDNMYGYYIKSWLPYTDYQNCWDGNYMLCDMSRNYSDIFNKLKSIDSMFTADDNYVNDFINALNNGITWYDGGNYVNLATDLYNYERIFPRHV